MLYWEFYVKLTYITSEGISEGPTNDFDTILSVKDNRRLIFNTFECTFERQINVIITIAMKYL